MSRVKGLLYSMKSLLRRDAADEELAEEIESHIERQTRKHIEHGFDPQSARTLALREFGGATRYREEVRDIRPGHWLDSLAQDARFAARTLRRHTGFSAVAVLTLAIGIGGTVAAYAIVDRVLLRPLPYREPERLVSLFESNDRAGQFAFSVPNLNDLAAAAHSFSAIGAAASFIGTLGVGDQVVEVSGGNVSGDLFEALGVPMLAGRPLQESDRALGAPAVIVIGHNLWRRAFAGDRSIVGRRVQLSGRTYGVVGIAPAGFAFPHQAEFWVACRWCDNPPPRARATINAEVVARLAPGVTLRQAEAEVATIAKRIHDRFPDPLENQMQTARVLPLQHAIVDEVRGRVWMLGAAVAFVLLIGCANLASANLARNTSRTSELALRTALGAGRRRIVQQLAVESFVLSLAGGVIGVLIARWTLAVIVGFSATRFPRVAELGMDYKSLAFALALSIAVALFIGLLPALQLSTGDLRGTMSGAVRHRAAGGGAMLRHTLIAGEIALTLVLTVGAGLAVRTLRIVSDRPLGVDAQRLLTIEPELNNRRYSGPGAALRFHEELIRRIEALPGVRGAAMTSTVPLGMGWKGFIEVEGRGSAARSFAQFNLVTDDYFKTTGLSLVSGRVFSAADDSTRELVTVINEAMANQYWPGESPLGRRIRAVTIGAHPDAWLTVIGVVGNVRTYSLEAEEGPVHYVPARQQPERAAATSLIVRTDRSPASVISEVRRIIRSIDPALIAKVEPLEDRVQRATADRRATAIVMSAFGAVAMLLAGIGVYGVLSYAVTLRTREFGIRMALGANVADVVRATLAHVTAPVLLGVIAGVAGAKLVSRVLAALVFQLSPSDPTVLAVSAIALVVVALFAAYFPSRRAARIDPMLALRSE